MTEQYRKTKTPAVSICIPVYNGEKYIREAIDSVLTQTYEDFELLISDNDSSDKTQEICTEYSNNDSRIRYIRQTINIGGHRNFIYTTHAARGDLVTWLAHDDILEPDFLKLTVQHMNDHPDAVLVASDFEVIDKDGRLLKIQELKGIRDQIDWRKRCVEFFTYPISNVYLCIYGLMRTETCRAVLQSVAEPTMAAGAELPILARFAAVGTIASIPAILRKYRSHADSLYSSELAAITMKPVHHRVLMDITNINRLRLDQMTVLFSSSYPVAFKLQIFSKVVFFYSKYFISKSVKITIKLAGILKSRYMST
jgi:glycosyltransferase involved in cell wall biosynthesis